MSNMFRFVTVIMICILAGAEVDLFTPSFPELQKVFSLSPFLVQLTLSVNFIAYCICSLFAGMLGDRYSKRSLILTSLSIFVFGSLLCVTAVDFPILILGRFFQGMGVSGPAVLGYVIISDEFPVEKQPAMMGVLNGVVTLAMAAAPILGSFVNIYFNWRGNFFLLLSLGMTCLIMSYFAIPNKCGDPSVTMSPAAYLPLIRSDRLITFILGLCFLVVPYWLFIGMSPILYMKDMGVQLSHFGFYQGAMSVVFAITSLLCSRVIKVFGQQRSLYFGMTVCVLSAVGLITIALLGIHNPIIITGSVLIFSVGAVFPFNILYPMALGVVENTKSRTAAMLTAIRLMLTALSLELVSFFYDGKFQSIGVAMFIAMILSFWFIGKLIMKDWINSNSSHELEYVPSH